MARVIPLSVGVKDIQDLFKEWLRKEKISPCAFDCPHYHVCRADLQPEKKIGENSLEAAYVSEA